MKKILIYGLVCMLMMIVSTFMPLSISEKTSSPRTNGNTLYVGGSGPNNYTKIQDAINDTIDGDTVYVYDDSSPYFESVVIDKSLNLIGEDKYSTVIDVQGFEADAVTITADNVWLGGFTIQNAHGQKYAYSGVLIQSNQSTIIDNIFQYNNWAGVFVYFGEYNMIQDNFLCNNTCDGIYLLGRYNRIAGNFIANNSNGITCEGAFHNNISFNIIDKNKRGFALWGFNRNNTIYRNDIRYNELGVEVDMSSKNYVIQNNFISNGKNAEFLRCPLIESIALVYSMFSMKNTYFLENYRLIGSTVWDGNYWDKPRVIPYPIFGTRGYYLDWFFFNRVAFDWHPAREPYDSPGIT